MKNRAALTLVELLLVLAVMASAACMVLPNLIGQQQHMQLRAQAAKLADELRSTRQFAIDHATPMCVGFSEDGASYWRYDLHHPSARTEFALSPGITLRSIDRKPSAVTEFVFHQDGSATACQFEIRASHASMMLTVERLTGNVTVEDMP